MTGTLPRGGGLRSMGASLLDQVLAETLDPAYAQAAERKAAEREAAEREAVDRGTAEGGTATRSGRRRGQVVVALVLALAGLLAAVTYNEAAASEDGRAQVRRALLGDIDQESGTADDLADQLADLRRDVNRTREQALQNSAVGQRALDQLSSAEQGAAAVPVSGPGLLVTLANAEPEADDDPVGGTTQPDPTGLVRDYHLQMVVNELWAAGAEAISIDGQRLGPTSAIRFAGEAVLVDFDPVTNPYEVKAIGDPDTLLRRFLESIEVRALASYAQSFGLRFDFAKEDDLSLPAASSPELRSAVAVPRSAPSTGQEPGG